MQTDQMEKVLISTSPPPFFISTALVKPTKSVPFGEFQKFTSMCFRLALLSLLTIT